MASDAAQDTRLPVALVITLGWLVAWRMLHLLSWRTAVLALAFGVLTYALYPWAWRVAHRC